MIPVSKKVHLVGAGAPAGVGMTRCLKDHYQVTGQESSQWSELMMECVKGDEYHSELNLILPDRQIYIFAGRSATSIPSFEQVKLCQDKAKTAEVLGDLAPKVYWVRDTVGAGGKGAQMASEVLPGRNYSVEFVVYEGTKVANFQKQRISYRVKEKTEGVANIGSSAVSVCTNYANVFRRAEEALTRVAKATHTTLHGFYGVDLKEDDRGVPKVTEINAGRLLTASYCFYYLTGYNLPLVGVRAFLGEEAPLLPDYPVGWGIIRQIGQEPRLFPPEITKSWLTQS